MIVEEDKSSAAHFGSIRDFFEKTSHGENGLEPSTAHESLPHAKPATAPIVGNESASGSPQRIGNGLGKGPLPPAPLPKRPPIAPKPKFLSTYKPRNLPEILPPVPERRESLAHHPSDVQVDDEGNAVKLESVRDRAKKIQDMLILSAGMDRNSLVLKRTPSNLSKSTMDDTEREDGMSVVSDTKSPDTHSVSTATDGGTSSEDDDTDVSPPHTRLHSVIVPNRSSTYSSVRYGGSSPARAASDDHIHQSILLEMQAHFGGMERSTTEIPSDVGKLRKAEGKKPARSVSTCYLTPPASLISEGSGGGSVVSVDATIQSRPESLEYMASDYDTGDKAEDARLKKLHCSALEFLTVEKRFVEYLKYILVYYPMYLNKYGKFLHRTILPETPQTAGGEMHVVHYLQKLLRNYYTFHDEVLLKDIEAVMAQWSSLEPNMSSVFRKTAPFLKECLPFLKEKQKVADQLTALCKENADFAAATLSFERGVFKRGVGAVIQQLDQVHQNFMRYKIMMLRYAEYLTEGSDEWAKSQEVIKLLETINVELNVKMGVPNADQLIRLHTQFQGQFDVFGQRFLIGQEDVYKQTRKERQPRTLVLFSDCLWLCRVTTKLGLTGLFETSKSYCLSIEDIRTVVTDHMDFDCYLEILSKKKSAGLWFRSQQVRDEWARMIADAKAAKLALNARKRAARLSERNRKSVVVHEEQSVSVEEEEMAEGTTTTAQRPPSIAVEAANDGELASTSDGETPIANGDERMEVEKKGGSEEQPVWINDRLSTRCLMDGCDNDFNLFNRRHHCRNCGWLICKECRGYAPVERLRWSRAIVCPECYDAIRLSFESGLLFPPSMLVEVDRGCYWVKIAGKHGKVERVNPDGLFKPPPNKGLRRMKNLDDRLRQGNSLFSKVYLRTKRGETEMHAHLAEDGNVLVFYKAAFDKYPAETHVIYGYRLEEVDLSEEGGGGRRFELRHANQHSKEEQLIAFRVPTETSARQWSKALAAALAKQNDEL